MKSQTTKLTIRLPAEDVRFAKAYATANGTTVTAMIDRMLRRMRLLEKHEPSPELEPILGLLPPNIDGEDEYRRHLADRTAP